LTLEVAVGWFESLKGSRKRFKAQPLTFRADGNPADASPAEVAEPAPVGAEPASRAAPPPKPSLGSSRPRSKRSGWLPSFRATASDQPRHPQSDRFAEARLRLRSAFTPSQPIIEPGMFAGRTEVLSTLIRAVEDEHLHAVIYGERGIGKTSLMHMLTRAAMDARYIVSYISCGSASRFDDAFRVVASDISLIYHSGYGPNSREGESGATFADLLPDAPISVRQASDYLARIVGTRVLIVLDEFDRAESDEFRLNIAEFLKNLSDRAIRVQVLIAGVAANLTELVENVPSIQRSLMAMPVPRMGETEVRDLVKMGEERSSLQFEESARRFIVSAANGLPYLASLLAHHAGLDAIDKSRLDVTSADVAAAVSKALAEQKGRISKRSQIQIAKSIQEGAMSVLGRLAHLAQVTGGAFSVDEIASAWPGPEGVARTQSLVRQLALVGVLVESQDEYGLTYRFAEDSVPTYLWLLAAQARHLDEGKSQVRAELGATAAH
jgi:Cdc6-like AAA superfamily ATPase